MFFFLQVTVPHGESFMLTAPLGDPFIWKANLTAGTNVVFTVKDAQNRLGGTSHILNVGTSDDSLCLESPPISVPPTRLPGVPTTSSLNPQHIDTSSSSPTDSGSKNNDTDNNTGVIVGASVGGTVALLLTMALVYCLIRRKGGRNGIKHIDLTGSTPGVSTSFMYHGHVAPTPYFVNSTGVIASQTTRNNGFPSASSTLTNVGTGPHVRNSSTAVAALVGTESLAGTTDTEANHSVVSFKREVLQQRDGQLHLYFDPYAKNWWQQQDYDFEPYADATSHSQRIGSTSASGAGPASSPGTTSRYSGATSP